MDETYFKVEFYNVFYTDANDTFDRAFTSINMTQCTRELFPYTGQNLYDRLLIDRYLCPESKEYSLMGDSNSKSFKDMEIFISKWSNSSGIACQTSDEIDRVMNEGFIDIAYTNAYFDFDDYDMPIKTYLSSSDNLYFVNNQLSWMQFLVQTNRAETSDNRLISSSSDSRLFYSIKNKVQRMANSNSFLNNPVALLSFSIDQESEIYERRVFTFIEMLSYLYGLYGTIFGFGGILVNPFKRQLLERSMMKRLYQVDTKKDHKKAPRLSEERVVNDIDFDNSRDRWVSEDFDRAPRTEVRLRSTLPTEEEKFK